MYICKIPTPQYLADFTYLKINRLRKKSKLVDVCLHVTGFALFGLIMMEFG